MKIKLPFIDQIKERFAKKERFSVGLDIGTSSVKIAKLKIAKDSIELCGFEVVPVQVDLTPVLKKLAENYGFTRVNSSISGPAVLIRYVNFPKMKPDELAQALKFEAQKHIPFSVNEVNLDAYILKDDLPDNKMNVLVAAVKKEFLSQRLKVLEDAGLRINLVDVDSLALINTFNFNYGDDPALKNKTVALLNIGTALSSVNILEDGIPRLTRDVHIAGNHFTQNIADGLGLEFKAAEELKHAPNKAQVQKTAQALELVLSNLGREIRISFDYYESQGASTVGKIFLSGAGSKLEGLKDALGVLLGIEVDYWDPLRKIIIADTLDAEKLKLDSGKLAVAVGLALRS